MSANVSPWPIHGGDGMRNDASRILAFAISTLLTLSAERAYAYCRTETLTSTVPDLQQCRPSATDCCQLGKPLYWKNICVGYSIQNAGTRQIPFDRVREVIDNAFTKWSSVQCASGKAPSLTFQNLGNVACDEVHYNEEGPNQNVIIFRDTGWTHTDMNNTLGLTTITFDSGTGEILDADMEINTEKQTLTAYDPIPPNGYDFDSIVTHEVGHFLGMAHSGERTATMWASYTPGNTSMRNLSPDDVSGVCSTYLAADNQPGAQYGRRATTDGGAVAAGSCDPTPHRFFASDCNDNQDIAGGGSACAVAPNIGATRERSAFAALGMALALGIRRARRAKKRPVR